MIFFLVPSRKLNELARAFGARPRLRFGHDAARVTLPNALHVMIHVHSLSPNRIYSQLYPPRNQTALLVLFTFIIP